jgi:hypothetical protein
MIRPITTTVPASFLSLIPQNYAQERQDLKGDRNRKVPSVQASSKGLSDCVKKWLSRFFDRTVLDQIRIHGDGLPPLIPEEGTGAATTSNQDIYFPKGEYNPHTITGIATIGHEIEHIMQFRKYGDSFGLLYLAESASVGLLVSPSLVYWGNRFEVQARGREQEIVSYLTAMTDGKDPCPK